MDASAATVHAWAIRLAEIALAKGAVFAGAESCTGGLVGGAITAVSGSSQWFDRGWVTYSNDAKMDSLGVREETLTRFGAVSEETAAEMAAGARARSLATHSFAVTGVAGPTGGSREKPVGMVCFGFASDQGVTTMTKHFAGNREAVRLQSVVYVLSTLHEQLMTNPAAANR